MKEIMAQTLSDAGFQVDEYTNGLLISLTNRKIATVEVGTVLMEKLNIQMGMSAVAQGVFIGTVTLLD